MFAEVTRNDGIGRVIERSNWPRTASAWANRAGVKAGFLNFIGF